MNAKVFKDSFTLDVLFQNINDARTKTKEIYCNILAGNYNVIALVETWLSDSHSELFDDRYMIFRKDRNTELRGKCWRGGVILAI